MNYTLYDNMETGGKTEVIDYRPDRMERPHIVANAIYMARFHDVMFLTPDEATLNEVRKILLDNLASYEIAVTQENENTFRASGFNEKRLLLGTLDSPPTEPASCVYLHGYSKMDPEKAYKAHLLAVHVGPYIPWVILT